MKTEFIKKEDQILVVDNDLSCKIWLTEALDGGFAVNHNHYPLLPIQQKAERFVQDKLQEKLNYLPFSYQDLLKQL